MQIIDSSIRLNPKTDPKNIGKFLADTLNLGIGRYVIAADDDFVCVNNTAGNRFLEKLSNKYSTLFWLACANPWLKERSIEILEKCFINCKCKGLYLNPGRQGFIVSEKIVYPLIKVCQKYSKPVFINTGMPIFSEPFQVSILAREFPEVKFIMGHAAWSDFSGYDLIPAAECSKNIYIETSCTVSPIIRQAIDVLGYDKLIFGSGYPRSSISIEVNKIKRMSLFSEVQNAIFCKNANHLWKLE